MKLFMVFVRCIKKRIELLKNAALENVAKISGIEFCLFTDGLSDKTSLIIRF
ncbi:hypothetical protein TPHV1_50150 [Treponema phagedenis]|uniref:Uncharacterized protein n=1 Tax=Treponema phagedenis TaxID=162 RepID=A0A0B7H0V3_TREPH|nr:hypothetical protein TPHV1_50150 [Treponema phagedenis]